MTKPVAEMTLPPPGTYVKFKKKYEIAKKGQLGRISEDGKSVGIWHCSWPVYMTPVNPKVLEVVPDPKPEKN